MNSVENKKNGIVSKTKKQKYVAYSKRNSVASSKNGIVSQIVKKEECCK
jgi:hypothetical protein